MSDVLSDVKREVFTYSNLIHAFAGMTGGATAITLFFPLNIIRMKVQCDESISQADSSTYRVAKKILDADGVKGFYQGWWSSVVALASSNFVYFYAYNAFKVIYAKVIMKSTLKKVTIDPITNLVIASVAGVINVLMTTPLWVAGTRLAVQRKKKSDDTSGKKPYAGVFDCVTRIISEEGVGKLWSGVGASLVLISNPTVQFVTYERVRGMMEKIAAKANREITSVEFFLMGAIAKAVATWVTYPLQIAQSRLRNDKEKKYNGTWDVLCKIYEQHSIQGLFKGIESKLYQTVLTAAFQFLVYEKINMFVRSLFLKQAAK